GHRFDAEGNRIRARHAEGRRFRDHHELGFEISRRSDVQSRSGRTQPSQGHRLFTSRRAGLLSEFDSGAAAQSYRVREAELNKIYNDTAVKLVPRLAKV